MISWVFNQQRLELTPFIRNKKHKVLISWGKDGAEEDNAVCSNTLIQFVHKFGGPCGWDQWQSDGISGINDKMWKAATKAWGGYPTITSCAAALLCTGTDCPCSDLTSPQSHCLVSSSFA
jgi:hypothetical protein